ncbi:hypothetical protein R6Q59_008955 [Mikania micrantha]
MRVTANLLCPPADTHHNNHIPAIPSTPDTGSGIRNGSGTNPTGKKRFRMKFTQDQKDKMHEIAEHVGWKMQKRDEDMIIGFCNQIGVDKNVFKVWMHKNKTTFGNKKDFTNNSSGEGFDFMISRNNHHHEDDGDTKNHRLDHHNHQNHYHHAHHHQQLHLHKNDSFSVGGNVICTKGSSSSSCS